nr:PREDICTED: uncharacterized protein LOC108194362 [Daucus carota subsp. sativus]
MDATIIILLYCSTLSSTFVNSVAVDSIRAHQSFRDGDTITSAGGEFEFGFFSPGSSASRYLGIWYKRISNGTVVWVANRNAPINNTLGQVRVNGQGITLETDDRMIWSTNTSLFLKNPVAQLLDSGNLVLRNEDRDVKTREDMIWQSFDYPGDTFLPGMKIGIDLVTGLDSYYTAWKSVDDPSTGIFSGGIDINGFPQFFKSKGSVEWTRTGPWNGLQFSGSPKTNPNGMFTEKFVFNEKEICYRLYPINRTSTDIRLTLTPNGEIKHLVWNYQNQIWMIIINEIMGDCDLYGLCGAYGICHINSSPRCGCLRGFVPKFPEKSKAVDWSSGCVRKAKLDCNTEAGFMKYSGVKLPDTRHSWYDLKINLEQCETLCLKNCNCTAYADADIRSGGSGCILWFNDLTDMVSTADGQDIYIRMPASELDNERSRAKRHLQIILIVLVVLVVVALALVCLFVLSKRKLKGKGNLKFNPEGVALNKIESEDWELPSVDFKTLVKATNNFSQDNKLGQGGFGPVYKGMLNDGQEVAVKRLSKSSGQGLDEFINEVSCIAKLQHRNLVTLLGCCTEKGERILIYEYMANKSLDSFIFDEDISNSMDWQERYKIINGIARGLLYLHQDSKLRIIHRDLKASNILLDHEMNPKISDFGMARCFKGSQTEANTSRIVGTYGYMSPEYAIDGHFSAKSDVYSFGVLLIEIVSGNKNRLYSHPDHSLNLLGHAWKSYNEDKLLGLVDEVILESSNQLEVFRVIQIGLLCVQEDPIDRPGMSQVVLMLSSNMKLPHPKKPGFFMERILRDKEPLLKNQKFSSGNELTFSSVHPRSLSSAMAISTLILLCSILSPNLMKSMAHQIIRDGETITSAGEEFQLGFFSPSGSTKRYLGIWYKKISNGTVIWVANRDAPVMNTSGILRVSDQGLSLQTGNEIIWSAKTSILMKNPVARLLGSGNLVVRDDDHHMNNTEDFVWQSFDYPADNLLPGMKMGIDLVTGLERYLTSWKSANDPSTGSFTDRLDPHGFPQFFRFKDSAKWSRTGPWNGWQFSGAPKSNQSGLYTEKFVFNEKEIYYKLDSVRGTSADVRFHLTPNGDIKFLFWNYQEQFWKPYVTFSLSNCEQYKLCGANGLCKISNSPRCECLTGFIPKFPEKWKEGDWSGGCVRKKKLDCGTKAGFLKNTRVKLPDTRYSWYDLRMTLEQCRRLCLKNCSCIAYTNADIRSGGSGCLLWFNELSDSKGYTEEGEDIYVKMASSELVKSLRSRVKRLMWIILIPAVIALTSLYMLLLWKRKQNIKENMKLSSESVALTELESEDRELPSVDFKRIANATDNFSRKNKLGEGGFGPVYKGIWNGGHEIAVKRLSKHSGQGQDEFINEVSCIGKLQHRNLVTLLGCCTEKGERILIYEYMANKSLDSFIFDNEGRNSMDWLQRSNIINGIARGLLYLHQDSKLRIIHRDLKASNILLDHEMNPKISDFGMARCFRGSQTEGYTSRIVGTYGYMSPEYASDGQFSVKSDVYSFGVILMEIVSGKKNRLFDHADQSLNLLGHAWRSYNEDKLLGLIDEVLLDSSNQMELFRVIQIGLLCVQEDPNDRPFMSEVLLMLSSKMQLPRPKKPGFFMERTFQDTDHLLDDFKFSSCNRSAITSLLPRQ